MPITNPIKRKEYARLSMAIKKARERGENINQLLEQRKSLTQKEISQLQKELENPERTEAEKSKIKHWIGVLEREVEKSE